MEKLLILHHQKTYPYLFWEGGAPLHTMPVLIDVVKQSDIHAYLEATLTTLGLQANERKDFIRYWEPKLQGNPYYRLSWYDAPRLQPIVSHTITPAPDTLIRVMMEYQTLESSVIIAKIQSYKTPARSGFTVVEWGGIAHGQIY